MMMAAEPDRLNGWPSSTVTSILVAENGNLNRQRKPIVSENIGTLAFSRSERPSRCSDLLNEAMLFNALRVAILGIIATPD